MANLYHLYFDEAMYDVPYKSTQEHIKELLCVLDMYIYTAIMVKEDNKNGEVHFRMRGITVPISQVVSSLESAMIENKNLELMEETIYPIEQAWMHIGNRSKLSIENNIALRFNILCEKLSLSDFESFCVLLAMACEYDKKYERTFEVIQENIGNATKGLAISLYELVRELEEEEVASILNDTSCLFDYLFLKENNVEEKGSKLSETIYIRKQVMNYLMGHDVFVEELEEKIFYFDKKDTCPQSIILKDKIEKVCQMVEHIDILEENAIINIFGERGIGKKLIVKNVAFALDFSVLFISLKEILSKSKKEIKQFINQILLEAVLREAVLCFFDMNESEEKNLEYMLKLVDDKVSLFFLLSVERMKNYESLYKEKICIEIEPLSIANRIVLWKEISEGFLLSEDVDMYLNANKYNLNAVGIKNVLNTAKLHSYYEGRMSIKQEDIIAAIKQQNVNPLGEYATLINAVFTWDDLVVDEDQKYQMQLLCNQLKYKSVVEEEWGFKGKMPYGKGICAMFYGSPGTGKTMAVQVIANELGMDLYRIDISQMVSKYIGETEKNITNLFKKAKNINALLFFDEADALFAKRSEVKDSHDRHANTETAHLLQKLEEYDGISILATNYSNNIDDAFKRRIKFIVHFSFPTPEIRYKIWTSILPKKAKVREDINFKFFADQFELSGSNIKEILLNAAYIAASKQKPISNAHIIEAMKCHFIKQGKLLLKEDLGEYDDLL